jgi:hypothetical protein
MPRLKRTEETIAAISPAASITVHLPDESSYLLDKHQAIHGGCR